jgi:choloylglycine hydrolase
VHHAAWSSASRRTPGPDPDLPNVASTIFRSVIDLTGGRHFFESTFAPNVVWIDFDRIDFSQGRPEIELLVRRRIFPLNGDVTRELRVAPPFAVPMNRR